MLTERAAALFNTLERQARRSLDEIAHLRQRLEALEKENARLRETLKQRDAQTSQTVVSEVGGDQTDVDQVSPDVKQAAPPRRDGERDSPALTDCPLRHEIAHETPAVPTETPPPSPQALLDEWYQRYTGTFFKGHTRPLQVGIHEQLIRREPWSGKLIRRALACYVHLPRYLKAVRAGVERVDLDGQPAGVVNAEEALHARHKLEALQARQRKQGSQRECKPEVPREAREDARLDHKLSELLAKHGRH